MRKEVSAFVDALHQFKDISFGMKNAPARFRSLTKEVISGLPNCAVYINDLLLSSQRWKEHLAHLHNSTIDFRRWT